MSPVKKLATVMSLIAMLAATALASPMCSICAPAATRHHAIQPARAVHDHCGSAQTKSPVAANIARADCPANNLSCIVSSEPEKPAMPSAPLIDILFVPAAQAAEASFSQKDFVPLIQSNALFPTPPLLTTNLRV